MSGLLCFRNQKSHKGKARMCIAPTKINIKRNNKNDTLTRDHNKAFLPSSPPPLQPSRCCGRVEGEGEDEGLPLKTI